MNPGVSIVICTYNGSKLLPETLRHIASQQVRSDVPWEVIIIDNASTDQTSSIVRETWAAYNSPFQFTILHQPKLGLTYARELGYAHSQYDFILLCDDDNWLNPDYVNLSFDIMNQYPNIGALGGYGVLEYGETPPYFATRLRLFGNGHQGPESGKLQKNTVYGAGCVLRKSAYLTLFKNGFNPLLTDRVAAALSSGGDYETCYALAMTGYDIWYDSRLTFKHYMVKERQTWEYYIRFFNESATCFEVLDAYDIIVNGKCQSISRFNTLFLKSFLYYIRELIYLGFRKIVTITNSEEKQVIYLKYLATTVRLRGFRKYFIVRNNFKYLLKFKKEQLIPALNYQEMSWERKY